MPGRFAPTPSGRMHIGNIYAMLGAWLSARSRGDGMLLRIEDIDEPRVVPGAAELMMDDLHWLGLDWDGDPVFQSARHDLYREALHCLENLTIDDAYDSPFDERNDHTPAVGSAANNAIAGTTPLIYPCFCSRADIRAASAPQEGDRFMVYPGTCRRLIASNPDTVRRRLANGDRHSLRIAMPADTNPHATVQFDDAVFGIRNSIWRTTSAIPSCAAPTACSPTSWWWSWTILTWASTTSCAAATCSGRTPCKSPFAERLSRRDSARRKRRPLHHRSTHHNRNTPHITPKTHGMRICRLSTTRPAAGSPNASALWIWGAARAWRHRGTGCRLLRVAAWFAGRFRAYQSAADERRRGIAGVRLG